MCVHFSILPLLQLEIVNDDHYLQEQQQLAEVAAAEQQERRRLDGSGGGQRGSSPAGKRNKARALAAASAVPLPASAAAAAAAAAEEPENAALLQLQQYQSADLEALPTAVVVYSAVDKSGVCICVLRMFLLANCAAVNLTRSGHAAGSPACPLQPAKLEQFSASPTFSCIYPTFF